MVFDAVRMKDGQDQVPVKSIEAASIAVQALFDLFAIPELGDYIG